MKTMFAFMAALSLIVAAARPAQAGPSVSIEFFYDSLAPYGEWVDVEGYGYCFRPTTTLSDPEWRPYSEGSWIYTDAGWTWNSEEDFGWACYHYGRWFLIGDTWFWQPGETWGPAWVSWRASDDFVGWAPLPPEAVWRPSTGFTVQVDVDYNIGPACYNFIPVRYLGEPRLRRYVEPWHRNADCMRRTVNCTRIQHRSNDRTILAIYNGGPDFDRYSRVSERSIRRMKLSEHEGLDATAPHNRLRNWSEDDRFRVIAPSVQKRERDREPAPAMVRQRFERSQVNRGWSKFAEADVRDLRNKVAEKAPEDRSAPREREPQPDERPPRAIPADPAMAQRELDRQREQQRDDGTKGRRPQDKPRDPSTVQREPAPGEGVPPRALPVDPRASEREQDRDRRPGDTPPGRERMRPDDNDPRRGIPPIPGRESRPLPPPERNRVSPEENPPVGRPPGMDRRGPDRIEDQPPGRPRTAVPGESGNSARPTAPPTRPDMPKVRPPEQKEMPRTERPDVPNPQRVRPEGSRPRPPEAPQARKIEPPKPAPQVEPRREETPKPPRPEMKRPDGPPPQKAQRPADGPPPQKAQRPSAERPPGKSSGKPPGSGGGGRDDDDKKKA